MPLTVLKGICGGNLFPFCKDKRVFLLQSYKKLCTFVRFLYLVSLFI